MQPISYPIHHPDGTIVAVHVRVPTPTGKRFEWRRPDGSLGLGGLTVAALPLYGVESLPADGPIVVTEGEKAAAALRSEGIAAVGTSTGASSTPSAESLAMLAGRAVVLWPDNDDVGRDHMTRIGAILEPIAAVAVVNWPDAPEHGDGADALDLLGAEGVHELIAAAQPFEGTRAGLTPRPTAVARASVTDVTALPEADGAAVLGEVERFLARYVVYPSEAARIAHVLWIGHAWMMSAWESTPRIAFLSPEPASGKSRALEVTEPLVPRAIHAVNVSPSYLFRKVGADDGAPTILFDEIDTVFGPRAKENEDIRGLLNAGHRRGAVTGRSVVRGKTVTTEELPAYCAVAMAGLDDLPDTLMSRSVVVRMRRRAPSEPVEPWRARTCEPDARALAGQLAAWAKNVVGRAGDPWPAMPPEVADRDADVWEALLAVADLAGGDWPQRARAAAVSLVTDVTATRPSLGVQLLADLRTIFDGTAHLSTESLLHSLNTLEESPWGDLRGKPLDARGLSRRLSRYGVRPKPVRVDGRVVKGYDAGDLYDPWARYLPAASVTSVTAGTSDPELVNDDTEPPDWSGAWPDAEAPA